MSISSNKTRTTITIEKQDKEFLEQIAKVNDRSLNYIINKALKQFISENITTPKK